MDIVQNVYVCITCCKAICVLTKASDFSNKQLQNPLAPHCYAPCRLTPGLLWHNTRPIIFRLVINNFGAKYVGKDHAKHLHRILTFHHGKFEQDWAGELFCGITLNWNGEAGYTVISITGYAKNAWFKFQYAPPSTTQDSPTPWNLQTYVIKLQMTNDANT